MLFRSYAYIESDRRIRLDEYFTTQEFAVSMWFYVTDAPTSLAVENLASYGYFNSFGNSQLGWDLRLWKNSDGSMYVQGSIFKGSTQYTTPDSSAIYANTWHHVTLTFKDNNLYLLLNDNILLYYLVNYIHL